MYGKVTGSTEEQENLQPKPRAPLGGIQMIRAGGRDSLQTAEVVKTWRGLVALNPG